MRFRMTRSSRLWILIAGALAIPLLWATTWYFRIQREPKGEVHTTSVLDYSGPLDASQSTLHVKIYKIEKLSTGVADTKSIFQNKIEVDGTSRHVEFMWPADGNAPFAGSDAAIQDINGDGVKEIAVYDGENVRIVTYQDGQLRFRPNADALDCQVYDRGPLKLREGFVFVCGVSFPNRENNPNVFIPRLFRWTPATGFDDVSKNHADYYRTKLLPDLQTRMASEEDAGRKTLYGTAIQQLTNELQADTKIGLRSNPL